LGGNSLLYLPLLIGIILIVITTKLTQAFYLSNSWVFLAQTCAALVIIIGGKLEVSHIIIGNHIELGYLTIPFTLVLLLGFTNVMNVEKLQNPSILLLPCVSLVCLSISAFIIGNPFVSITGICASLTIMFILLYVYFSGKLFVGRTLTTSIGFLIAVLSLSLFNTSILMIYIPIFTLALPFTLYYLTQDKISSVKSFAVSSLIAIFFGVLMFKLTLNILYYLVVGLMIILVITQFSRKYRFS